MSLRDRGQRVKQQLVALARRQCGHAQQVHRAAARSRGERCRIRARLDDVDSIFRHAVGSQGRRGAAAGHDDARGPSRARAAR